MKHIVNIDTWERRDNYNFFKNFSNSWYSVTTEIKCSEAYKFSKEKNYSFFLLYLYAVLKAANEIKEFRYRTDKNGQVVFYDNVDIITPIAVEGKTFHTVRIPYSDDFKNFYETAQKIIKNIPKDSDPYGTDKEINETGEYNIIHLSAVPKMYFTGMTYTVYREKEACTFPLSTAGKVILKDKEYAMPFAVYVNHAFIDGFHLEKFFEKIEENLKEISFENN